MINGNGRTARFLNNTWGAIAAFAAAMAVGIAIGLRITGITDLPGDVDLLQEQAKYSVQLQEWIVCNSVPPNRPDILQALQVVCPAGTPRRAAQEVGPPPVKPESD